MALGDVVIQKGNKRYKVLYLFVPHLMLLIIIIIFLGYYIIVNTSLKEKTLPFLKLNGHNIGLMSKSELDEYINEEFLSEFENKVITVQVDDRNYKVLAKDFNLNVNSQSLVDLDKGDEPKKIANDLLNLIQNKSLRSILKVDESQVMALIPYRLSEANDVEVVAINNQFLTNCHTSKYDMDFDRELLSQHIVDAIISNSDKISINSLDYVKDEEDRRLIKMCKIHDQNVALIEKFYNLISKGQNQKPKYSDVFGVKIVNNNPEWQVINAELLAQTLTQYKQQIDQQVEQGKYEVVNNNVYLFEKFKIGKSLLVDESIQNITTWLRNPKEEVNPIKFELIKPEAMKLNLNIYDFTQIMGSGETRMHLYYDNTIGQAGNAIAGLEEIHNHVIHPGEEFSYFNHIQPQGAEFAFTRNGRFIGMGICTSVTTLFRSVLDSGLPVTDRQNHAEYVWKYQWNPKGDPAGNDLVDATFFGVPDSKVDFKFRNDFKKPILLRSEIWNDGEYQYHRVTIRSASVETKRKVQLSNWRTSNYIGPTTFNSEFDRTVYEGDKLLFTETYFSDYQY